MDEKIKKCSTTTISWQTKGVNHNKKDLEKKIKKYINSLTDSINPFLKKLDLTINNNIGTLELEKDDFLGCDTIYFSLKKIEWEYKNVDLESKLSLFFCHHPNRIKITSYTNSKTPVIDVNKYITLREEMTNKEQKIIKWCETHLKKSNIDNGSSIEREYLTSLRCIEYPKVESIKGDELNSILRDKILQNLLFYNGKTEINKIKSAIPDTVQKISGYSNKSLYYILIQFNNDITNGITNKNPASVCRDFSHFVMTNS